MAMVINSNIMSLSAQQNLNKSQNLQSQTMERLSSGLRINSAKDDAAGSAIVSRLTSQIKGLDQAVRNANDGISLVQTAEGALSESSNILQRMRELAVQSANGTYTSGNRSTLNAESQQLIQELDRISSSTNFNGLNLMDGSVGEIKLQIGSDANQTIGVSIGQIDAESLGVEDTAGVGSFSRTGSANDGTVANAMASAATDVHALGSGDLIINGIAIDGAQASYDTASAYGKSASAISTAAAINEKSDQTGVTAIVGATELGGQAMTVGGGGAVTGSINLNGVDITLATVEDDTFATRAGIVDAINKESDRTGVTAIDTGSDNGGITLQAADGRNITLHHATAGNLTEALTGLDIGTNDDASITTGTVTLVSDGGQDISITSGATGNASDAGFMEGTYSGTKTQVSSNLDADAAGMTTAMTAGNVYVNGVSVGPSYAQDDTASSGGKEFSAISKAAAFNLVSDKTGVTAVVNENRAGNTTAQTATTGSAVSGSINGVAIAGFSTVGDTSADRQSLVSAINAIADQTGVRAVDTGEDGTSVGNGGGGVQLVAEDGRNIITNFLNSAEAGFNAGPQTHVGEFTLTSDREIEITRGTNENLSNSGLKVGGFGGGEDGMAIKNVDISTAEGAQEALTAIDNALSRVNDVRADLGAVNNRLDFTINNLSSISTNAAASRSRIQDADFASETAQLSRAQVLQQAGTAMLAQANAAPQQVLSLLQ
ncbi:flagellin [Thiorhodococcus minor]|uniref:Flagellin n=1 Tax=Thiorhodococcus minor TaxID=57489 RepID=A0A6M0JVS6_9GAMM|nr:flagellin [Thiorhodococcus minor]NEV60295.1 flagellin [Thiorhodococcus minor]